MMADNRYYKSKIQKFINNDPQYNFGGWTPQRLDGATSYWWYKSAFNTSAVYYRSVDLGKTWFVVDVNPYNESPTFAFNESYFWDGNKFVGLYRSQGNNIYTGSTLQYSNEGLAWDLISNITDITGMVNAAQELTKVGDYYYLSLLRNALYTPEPGSGTTLYISTDLSTWTPSTNSETYQRPRFITTNGNILVGAGSVQNPANLYPNMTGNTFYSLDNGYTLLPNTNLNSLITTRQVFNLVYNGIYFMITTTTSTSYRSSDGITWEDMTPYLFTGLGREMRVDGEWVYMFGQPSPSYPSSGTILYKTKDLQNFTPVYTGTQYRIFELWKNGNLWNAGFYDTSNTSSFQTRWSEDGITWYDCNNDIRDGSWGDEFATNA